MPYAAKARVPVDRTRAEIQALLDKRGVVGFWSSDEPEKGMIGFFLGQSAHQDDGAPSRLLNRTGSLPGIPGSCA
jgi:hypothetical protein